MNGRLQALNTNLILTKTNLYSFKVLCRQNKMIYVVNYSNAYLRHYGSIEKPESIHE